MFQHEYMCHMLLELNYSSYMYEIDNMAGMSKKRARDTRQKYL